MKTTVLMTLMISLFALNSCQKDEFPEVTICILDEVDTFKTQTCAGQVDSYTFNGKTVFAFADSKDNCTDGGVTIMDEDCVQICFLGGIAGFTECEGMDFYDNAIHKNLIWEK